MEDLIAKIPMDQLASRLGVDTQTAERATRKAVPALVHGMHANARDPARAASLQKAIGKHHRQGKKKAVNAAEVDTADGDRIVRHVFGSKSDQVISHLDESQGEDSGLMGKVLPMVAPMVMSHLADEQSTGGGGIGDLLGGVLGGKSDGGVGSMLGGLLGDGRR